MTMTPGVPAQYISNLCCLKQLERDGTIINKNSSTVTLSCGYSSRGNRSLECWNGRDKMATVTVSLELGWVNLFSLRSASLFQTDTTSTAKTGTLEMELPREA